MKIGYICNQSTCVSGASNGIRMQALIWRDELIRRGHEVILINAWETYDWQSFDIVHAFSFGDSISFLHQLKKFSVKIVCSPIIDSNENKTLYKLSTKWGVEKLRLTSPGYNLRQQVPNIDLFLARTCYEASYIRDCFDIPSEMIAIVPLSYRSENIDIDFSIKEEFCLHVSSITQPRKNVMRLMEAAVKYKFNLVLAGSTGSSSSFEPFKKIIDANDNIKCLGFISEKQLDELYTRAKVFALPSIIEGVGLVALEAAMHGCNIVVTNIGGPKEYYADNAFLVNPYDIDEIGDAVRKAFRNQKKQSQVMEYVKNNFNLSICVDALINAYQLILNK